MLNSRSFVSFALSTLGMACLSAHSGQTARTVGTGNSEVGFTGGAAVSSSFILVEPLAATPYIFFVPGLHRSGTITLPDVDIVARFGVSDRADLSAGGGLAGVHLGGKVMVTDPADQGLAVSVAPSLNVWPGLITRCVQLNLPVLVGVPVGDHELTIGPRYHRLFINTNWYNESVDSVGSSMGFAFRVGEKSRLLPEVSVLKPLSTDEPLIFFPTLTLLRDRKH